LNNSIDSNIHKKIINQEGSMSEEMTFRKDCEVCGRSYLTPDRKARFCPRCWKDQKIDQRVINAKEEHILKTPAAAKASDENRLSNAPADNLKPHGPKKNKTGEMQNVIPKSKAPEGIAGKTEAGPTAADQSPEPEKPEIILTEAQEQEVIERYQTYVQRIERPPKGRRKTIAAEMELPYQTVVFALRKWNQSRERDLSREDRFSVEKAYFLFMEKENSFAQLKERICRETGLNPWSVSRYLDILHDGEDKLKEVPDVSPEQKMAILAAYKDYLAGSSPPGPFLHPMIAEKIGIKAKLVHKVLVAYRLGRFRERWS
jgi:hypothetical protein